jgi:hypothetical protein
MLGVRAATVGSGGGPAATCQPEWLETFAGPNGTDARVAALASFDNGGGEALYVGGEFTTAGTIPASFIARWDGSHWSPLSNGVNAPVRSLAAFDDGTGPALYAGGDFTTAGGVPARHIAKWNGTSWAPLGLGVDGEVLALGVFDDGSGAALYAGGTFTHAGGGVASHVAKWNGSSWSPLALGVDGDVRALVASGAGTGVALYAGGSFANAGGNPAPHIARWDGASWSPLDGGVDGDVLSLAMFDDGAGPGLFAGGAFTNASSTSASHVAKWDGANWSPVGNGLSDNVRALCVFQDSGGTRLWASVDVAYGTAADVARLTAAGLWVAPSYGMDGGTVDALAVFHHDGVNELFAGGGFSTSNSLGTSHLARTIGGTWLPAGGNQVNDAVHALAVFDDGGGPALYVGGAFTFAGSVPAKHVARWNGTSWSQVGGGMNGNVDALLVFDDGSGPQLYAGGTFTTAGGLAIQGIARWSGTSWLVVGSPYGIGQHSVVHALAAFDDGTGTALYAGGQADLGQNIAKWDGAKWTPLMRNMTVPAYALASFDDGTGPALYTGSFHMHIDGVPFDQIAKWNGSTWSDVGGGVGGAYFGDSVKALATFDDGSGPALYVGGEFARAGGVATGGLARWNGAAWSALVPGVVEGIVSGLGVCDDGTGPELFIGGGLSLDAKWSGSTLTPLTSGVQPGVSASAFATFDDGHGPAVYAGGININLHPGDPFLAKWANPPGCGAPGASICEPNVGGVMSCPCANNPATSGAGCDNSAHTGGATLGATGIARLSFDSVVLRTSGELASATSIVLQGDGASPSGVVFGQGVRCATGTLKRLYVEQASNGAISVPHGNELHVHAQSQALGDPIAPGTHRYYGVYYRDPNVLGGCPSASTFNITQQIDLLWGA